TADIANVARPQGGTWDISAYEFPSGTATYTISGTVKDGGGVGISGVTVALTGTSSANYTTGADGTYSFSGLVTGNYTVTPSKSGYTFTPANRSYTSLAANQTGQDFTGSVSVPTYSISGTVTVSGGGALSGVTMTLTGTSGGTYTTAADGTYSFSGLITGNYTVTPTLSAYTFSPVNRSYTSLSANQTAQDFVGTASGFYFTDNFENWTGSIGPWDELRCDFTNCTGLVVRDSGTVKAGTYSLKSTDNATGNGYEANLRKGLTSTTATYSRIYMRFPATGFFTGLANNMQVRMFYISGNNGAHVEFWVGKGAGGVKEVFVVAQNGTHWDAQTVTGIT